MSVLVTEIYQAVCFALLEDGGFTSGVFTESRFLDTLSTVVLDFCQRTDLDKTIFTEMINAGVAEYLVPEDIMKPQMCFLGGRLIEKVTRAELDANHFEWSKQWGVPRQWHSDNLVIKKLELFPKPDFNGSNIEGDSPPWGKYGDWFPTERNLTIVGSGSPAITTIAITDTIEGVPDSFTPYLVYGVLAQIFSADGETKDVTRANYCRTRYNECFDLADAILNEELMEEDS